jgi:hypothetical protein
MIPAAPNSTRLDGDFNADGFGAVRSADMHLDFGDGNGLGLTAAGAVSPGLFGMVADGAEGEHKTAFALVVNQGGDFSVRCGRE